MLLRTPSTTFDGAANGSARGLAAALLVAFVSACTPLAPPVANRDVKIKIIAFNDFHGYVTAAHSTVAMPDPGHPDRDILVPTGGAPEMATMIARLRAQNPNNIIVAAGDLVGASPLSSGLFLDEPTIEALNQMGLEISSVGNHEFDRGQAELLRKQNGGCEQFVPTLTPCQVSRPFAGARFQYLAANVWDKTTHAPIFPAYAIRSFDGLKVGFIGVTLEGTKNLVPPAGISNLEFRDEAATINALVPVLLAKGVRTIVVLIHQGAFYRGRLSDTECPGLKGELLPILDHLDPSIQVVISGHTHEAYTCHVNGRLITSALSYSRLVTDIDLVIDRESGRIVEDHALNRVIAGDPFTGAPVQISYPPLPKDPAVVALLARYANLTRAVAERPVGRITATLVRPFGGAANSSLGNVVADSELAATRSAGAQIAFCNPGGIRTDLTFVNDGAVSYAAAYAALPFGNELVTVSLTGEEIKALLEEQWSAAHALPFILAVSKGFEYSYSEEKPLGAHVTPGSLKLDGVPIKPAQGYRVTINSYMAGGGDGFAAAKDGQDAIDGMIDVEAFVGYLAANGPLSPTIEMRVRRER